MSLNKDKLSFGMLIGLFAPFVGVIAYYLYKYFPTFSLLEYFTAIVKNKSVLTAVSSASLMVNVLIFTYYINKKIDHTARGIFVVSCLYILVVIFYKLLH